MPPVQIRDGCLHVGDQRVPVFAGEMHYWRLDPARWGACLDRYRQIGLNMVATYVPWEYHELEPGRFDFTGASGPQRNLVGFLELLCERGFWIFIRPGPFIYAEWTNAGVPDRIASMPRLAERYRAEARVWMEAVTRAVRPYFATGGDPVRGRIALFQPDNEMDLFSHWFERECGLDAQGSGFFQRFLQETYGDVAALNAAWGTGYTGFDQARAQAGRLNQHDPRTLTRHKDYWRFQHWATRKGVRWHAEEYRALGVDLPMVANYYPGGDVQNWRELRERGGVDALGIDWYPRSEFAADKAHHRQFLDSCRIQRAVSPLPMIAEFEAGYWHGWHDTVGVLTPNHYRLMAFSALAAGIRGWNWYMLVNRDNWYFSPINERGELRPELGEVFIGIQRVVDQIDPPCLEKLAGAAVFLDPLHIATDGALADNPVLTALYEGDIDYEMVDAAGLEATKPLLFYSGADWLSREHQRRLVEYMERGGTLVVFQGTYPQRDEHFRPCNGLGVAPPDAVLSHLGKKVEADLVGGEGVLGVTEGGVWLWNDPAAFGAEPIFGTQVAGKQQAVECADVWMKNYIGRRFLCGYRKRWGGSGGPGTKGGELIVLGVPPSPGLVRALHRAAGGPLYAQARIPGVHTALFRGSRGHVLVATNMNGAAVQCRVALEGIAERGRARITDLWTGEARDAEAGTVVVSLGRASGGAWRIERDV